MQQQRLSRLAILAAIVFLGALMLPVNAMSKDKLYLFNWSEYMDPDIIKQFEKQYNVKVVQSFFESNPELFAKLQAGGDSQFDVIVPSSYYITRLAKAGLVQPLKHELLPNLDNLMPEFRDPAYDPDDKYSAAYQWGTTGFAYNTKRFPDHPDTWSILFDPEVNPKYPFALVKDPLVAFGSACAYLGYGFPCQTREQYQEAAKLIIKTKERPNFTGFVDGTPANQGLARGTIAVGMTFNGDYLFYKDENPEDMADIEYVAPLQGSELWVDLMAIPAHAPNPELAHKFINFMLDADVGARLSEYNFYATPNAKSVAKLPELLRTPPILPTEDEMQHYHFSPELQGDELQYVQQLWTAVQSN